MLAIAHKPNYCETCCWRGQAPRGLKHGGADPEIRPQAPDVSAPMVNCSGGGLVGAVRPSRIGAAGATLSCPPLDSYLPYYFPRFLIVRSHPVRGSRPVVGRQLRDLLLALERVPGGNDQPFDEDGIKNSWWGEHAP